MHALLAPWSHDFMQRALLELILVGIAGAVLGCWVVYFDLAYSAESLAHSLFPGLVVAALTGVPLLFGAVGGALIAALSIALVARVPTIGADSGVAVVITTLFGLGVLLALSPASPPGLQQLLFGDPLGVTRRDLVAAALLAGATLAALVALHRRLLVVGFDRSVARALGAQPGLVGAALLGLTAIVVLIGVQGLGNLLVVAVIVGPAATARMLTRRMSWMMLTAALVAAAAATAGLYLSYYAETAAGASVALALIAGYVLALLASVIRSRAASVQTP
jgi:ABC-type Mn2+/Zn2+ transport system permease subunit